MLMVLLAQAREAIAADELYFDQLTSRDSTTVLHNASEYSQTFLWMGVAVFFIAVVVVPRMLNRMLNLGSVLSIAALALTAVGMPYALRVANNPTKTPTNAAIGVIPRDVRITPVSSTRIHVSWETDTPALGTVRYGTSADNLSMAQFSSDPPREQTKHVVMLENLSPGTPYYLRIVVGAKTFGDNGEPILVETPY